jgi:hypothetical protein
LSSFELFYLKRCFQFGYFSVDPEKASLSSSFGPQEREIKTGGGGNVDSLTNFKYIRETFKNGLREGISEDRRVLHDRQII